MKALLSLFFSSALLCAQETPNPQLLIQNLFEQRDPKAFEEAYAQALAGGASNQALVEARFLYIIDTGDNAALAAYVPVLEKQAEQFSLDDSVAFAVPEDFYAIVEYGKAIAAFEKNDTVTFKKHITEAFWLSPAQADIFGKLVDEVRMKETMASLQIDMARTFTSQDPNIASKPLKEHIGEANILLLHFWSPWARESLESMDDFYLTASELRKNGVSTVSILLSGAPESLKDANNFIRDKTEKTQAPWLLDSPKNTLGSKLRVQSFPTVTLLDEDGNILFNGHPGNPSLWTTLKKKAPQIEKPISPVRNDLPTPKKQ